VPPAFGDRVDFQQLLDQGFATLPVPEAPFAEGGFPTPSGKCEFFSARLAAQGLDGLPDHLPNHEPAGSDPRHPLAMISPPARNFLNSSFVNVKSLRDIEGEPLLEITRPTTRAARHRRWRCGAGVQQPRQLPLQGRRSRRGRARAWSTAWASGGASWAWTAPT
jgi:hypothetical protein